MTRRPNPTRALHQLERHGRGTPNDPLPPVPNWAAGLAALRDGLPTAAQASANLRALYEAGRYFTRPKDCDIVEAGDTTMNSGGALTTGQPTLTIPWRG